MIWTEATVACECGSCGRRLVRGDRIALLTDKRKVRCPECMERTAQYRALIAPPVDLGEDLKLDDELALDRDPGEDDA